MGAAGNQRKAAATRIKSPARTTRHGYARRGGGRRLARSLAAAGREAALVGLVLVAPLWASTLAVQMPLHGRLAADGHAAATVTALVRSNWPRTILWTARAVLAAWMLAAG